MPSYRFYILNAAGKIGRTELMECATDAAAMKAAQELLADRKYRPAVEVWRDDRFVGGTTREEMGQPAMPIAEESPDSPELSGRTLNKVVDMTLHASRGEG